MTSMVNRRLFTVALVWLTLTVLNSSAKAEAAATPKAVFVIVDGIPADVVERVATPAIDAIGAAGAMAAPPWAAQLESRVKPPRSQRRGI